MNRKWRTKILPFPSKFWHRSMALVYFTCSPAHPGSWRISRWIMGCRVSAQVALISFLWSALLREENCCVLQVEIWIIALLKILVMYYASWFCHDFRHSFCHVFLLVILVWSLWFEFVSFSSVFCDWINCLNFALFLPLASIPSLTRLFALPLVCLFFCSWDLSHLEKMSIIVLSVLAKLPCLLQIS